MKKVDTHRQKTKVQFIPEIPNKTWISKFWVVLTLKPVKVF